MKIPEFKPSRNFLGEYDLPCLVAEIKNSEVGLALECVAKYQTDPPLKIYLRGRDQESISPWQRQKLELLFEKDGLTAALAEGLKGSGYGEDVSEEDRPFFEAHGYSPYFHVLELVIDDIKQKVLFLVDDEFHVLHEHLGTIYLKRGRWHFEEYDYYLRYANAFEKQRINNKAIEIAEREKLWDTMFPPPEANTPVEKDCSFIYGRWEVDKNETSKLSEQFKWDVTVLEDDTYAITAGTLKHTSALGRPPSAPIIGLERQGNWVTVTVNTSAPKAVKVEPKTFRFWWTGNNLVGEWGMVFRKVDPWEKRFPMRKPEERAVSDLKWLAGDWWFSERKTAEVFSQLGKSKVDLELAKQERASAPCGFQFVEGKRNLIIAGEPRSDASIVSCERCANHFFLNLLWADKPSIVEYVWCDGLILVERSGVAYERAAGSKPNK